jgi:hypothetical protein
MGTDTRVVYAIVRAALGIILLSKVTFIASYPEVYQSSVNRAGLSALNASIVNVAIFRAKATSDFWWYFPSLMTNSAELISTAPVTCSGPDCFSYFLPGAMSLVAFDPALPYIGKENYTEAGAFIVHDAPGFQMDFFSVSENVTFKTDECHQYGIDAAAIQICIQRNGNNLIGGS